MNFFDADGLPGEDRAEVDLFASQTDASVSAIFPPVSLAVYQFATRDESQQSCAIVSAMKRPGVEVDRKQLEQEVRDAIERAKESSEGFAQIERDFRAICDKYDIPFQDWTQDWPAPLN